MKKLWLKFASEETLRNKNDEIRKNTDWDSGSILDGDFDKELEDMDAIDDELNKRSWRKSKRTKKSDESYGVHREHGWYLPNDD